MSELQEEAAALQRWLFEQALPLWWRLGADRAGGAGGAAGGDQGAIGLDGRPVAKPHRARSIARMVFAYCEAGRLGWSGPWREAARHALACLGTRFVTADGTVASVVGLDGAIT